MACHREFTGIVAACPHDGTVLVPLQQDQLIGTKLADRYLIMSVIGHGGMGVVYKARHELMDRIVAIKMLQSQLISDSMSVKRFQQEARAASKLKHPNVITLYDFGVSPTGQPYLVMDYLEGVSLADVIKKEGQVGVDRSVKIFGQACSALDHAHKQGVIHRDLKPGNIMLVEDDQDKDCVKVVDFGVAKLLWGGEEENQRLTQTGEVCGSPVYMSPEQCQGQKLDQRSDVYSMGVVMYEALTGRLPLLGKTMVDTMSKHISEMPQSFGVVRPDLYIPERLEAVIFRALAKDPASRLQSMEEFEQELKFAIPKPGRSPGLRGVTSERPTVTMEIPKSSVTAALEKQPEKSKAPIAIAIVLVVIAAIAGGAFWIMSQQPQAQSPQGTATPPASTSGASAPSATPTPAGKSNAAPKTAVTPAPAETKTAQPNHAAALPPAVAAPPLRPAKPTRTAQRYRPRYASRADSGRREPLPEPQASQQPAVAAPTKPAADPFEQLKRERSY
jgi:serine/threonine-protein kinase